MMKIHRQPAFIIVICSMLVLSGTLLKADDTALYSPAVQHNVVILLDTSGSMNSAVYEDFVDYQGFINTLCSNYTVREEVSWYGHIDNSPVSCNSTAYPRNEIFLVASPVGYDAATGVHGDLGEAGFYGSFFERRIKTTGTTINSDGLLTGGNIAYDPANYVTYGGLRLQNNQDILDHVWQDNPDGTRVDKGFAGNLLAPGFYFSGYFVDKNNTNNLTTNPSEALQTGDIEWAYFFVTGNFINFHNLLYLETFDGRNWSRAWENISYDLSTAGGGSGISTIIDIPVTATSKQYPREYPNSYDSSSDRNYNYDYRNPNAAKMRIHFDNIFLWDEQDKIEIKDASGRTVQTISGRTDSTSLYSDWVTGSRIIIRFTTGRSNDNVPRTGPVMNSSGWGFNIDKYQYEAASDPSVAASGSAVLHQMESRLKVATDAMVDVIEQTRGKINWSIMQFNYDPRTGADGAVELSPLNASFNDDLHKQNLINHLTSATAQGGTPLGESLQDVYTYVSSKTQQIYKDCNKTFVITLTDGFPSDDTSWTRMTMGSGRGTSVVDFASSDWHDAVQFTTNPTSSSVNNDYYDDIAKYLYERSWPDDTATNYTGSFTRGDLIPEGQRNGTPDNIIVHNVGFNNDNPMLQRASDNAGGIYITAYSKSQLMSAFNSLGMLISQYTSYTAPVVSVDETNRVQSGDKIYTALFKPINGSQWLGNLKKYGLEYGVRSSCKPENEWYLIDQNGNSATDCEGNYINVTSSYWTLGTDGGEVDRGGAGSVLLEAIPSPSVFAGHLTSNEINRANNFRKIYTFTENGAGLGWSKGIVASDNGDITNLDFGVSTDLERYKILNYLYGYTYDADIASGAPIAKRSWPIGSIIHSNPEIIDYFDPNGNLKNRYIALGSNDGMLHIFKDTVVEDGTTPAYLKVTEGSEIIAFVPREVMPTLHKLGGAEKVYTVDGPIMTAKDSSGSPILIFGLRRGGRAYYALDISDPDPTMWTVKWVISNYTPGFSSMGYSFARPGLTKIQTGESTYKNLLIIPGGYDPIEDNYSASGGDYELEIPIANTATGAATSRNTMGNAIYIVDIDDGSLYDFLTDMTYPVGEKQFAWPSDPTWISNNFTHVRSQMRYGFAADPAVVNHFSTKLFQAAYLVDIFGQVWKLHYLYDSDNRTAKFTLNIIFKANPATDQHTAYFNRANFESWTPASFTDPRGTINFYQRVGTGGDRDKIFIKNPRKTFNPIEISWAGNCYTDIPVLFLGTGDRAHPTFTGTHNAVYAFYDAHSFYNLTKSAGDPEYSYLANIFNEKDLLNVSGGALEPDVMLDGNSQDSATRKENIFIFLRKKAKGWYTLLDPDMENNWTNEFPVVDDDGSHDGEKIISPMNLFAKVLYTPTYQPLSNTDPCSMGGKARLRAVDYCTGNAAYNFYNSNDQVITNAEGVDEIVEKFTRLDRYLDIGYTIPSGVSIITREGTAGGFISVDEKTRTVPPPDTFPGMVPIYWQEIFNDE